MADIDLPVFSFRPNRAEPLTERLSFLTDVLRSLKGAEQRRSLRPTPRRTFEADFLLVGAERTFWDHFIAALSGQEMMVPLFWEVVGLPATLGIGSNRINFNTQQTEWPYFAGGLALIVGKSALESEVVRIGTVDATGINLSALTLRSWPRGTKLYPLRRGFLEGASALDHITAATAKVTGAFHLNAANPWTPAASTAPVYLGRPVLLDEPNWVDELEQSYDREIATLDTEIGLVYRQDTLGRALVGQAHRWFLPKRAKLAAFRDLIYRNLGRTGSFWLPTFKADFKLETATTTGSTFLQVENTGFRYTGGPQSGREYIAIRHAGGTIFRRITSVIAGPTSATERLVLDSPVGLALSTGQVRKISFMDTARFDSDDFEIVHYAGADGHHECTSRFRTFLATRTAPEPISYPIPEAYELPEPCGENIPSIDHYEFWTVHTETSPPGMFGRPGSGNRLFLNGSQAGVSLVEYVCGDPDWDGARVSHFTADATRTGAPEGTARHEQQGQGSPGCTGYGAGNGQYEMYVQGPNWPGRRKMPAISVTTGALLSESAIRIDFFGNFPESAVWGFFPSYNDPRYVD